MVKQLNEDIGYSMNTLFDKAEEWHTDKMVAVSTNLSAHTYNIHKSRVELLFYKVFPRTVEFQDNWDESIGAYCVYLKKGFICLTMSEDLDCLVAHYHYYDHHRYEADWKTISNVILSEDNWLRFYQSALDIEILSARKEYWTEENE